MVGSSARLMNVVVLPIAPLSSNPFLKNMASLAVIPIAPKTMENLPSPSSPVEPGAWAWVSIWRASSLAGSPEPEKIGSFCPLTRVLRPSMADIPVCMKCEGFSLATGFIGRPFMSSLISGMTGGSPSIGSPMPLNVLPSMSMERPVFATSPLKYTLESSASIPAVPSSTWMTAVPSISWRTWPFFISPLLRRTSAISPTRPPRTLSRKRRGPDIRLMVLYSLVTSFINKTSFSDSLCIPEPILKNLPRAFQTS